MPVFFTEQNNIADRCIVLTGDDTIHIMKTLRMRVGDFITISDGEGTDYRCKLETMVTGQVMASVLESFASKTEPSVALTLYVALPKGDKTELIVQKAVELGAYEIVFYQSHRCVARPEAQTADKRMERLCRIAQEAAKQAERSRVPRVRGVIDFKQMLMSAAKSDLPIFLYERGGNPIREIMEQAVYRTAAVVSGPEGGFEKSELDEAVSAGLHVASLGSRILRCETAPICAASVIMFHSGNL